MKTKKDIRTEYRTISLEYDEEKYKIQYAPSIENIIIKRIKDDKVIGVFDAKNTGFIIQSEIDGYNTFEVSVYSEEDEQAYLYHYYDDLKDKGLVGGNPFVSYISKNAILSMSQNDVQIDENLYLIYITMGKKGYALYNGRNISQGYNKIYLKKEDREKAEKSLGKNVIMVSQKFKLDNAEDTILYGIDIETFEAVTPIWSELQQRFINVPSTSELNDLQERTVGLRWDDSNETKTERTIEYEIFHPLVMVNKYLDRKDEDPMIRKDTYHRGEPNEEFIMKFKKKETK